MFHKPLTNLAMGLMVSAAVLLSACTPPGTTAQGTVSPAAGGASTPAAVSTTAPSAGGTASPSAAGTSSPSAMGTSSPSAAGTGSPSAAGTASPSAAATGSPSALGTTTPSSMAQSGTGTPSAVGTSSPASGTASPVTGTASPVTGVSTPGAGTTTPAVGTQTAGVGTPSPVASMSTPSPATTSVAQSTVPAGTGTAVSGSTATVDDLLGRNRQNSEFRAKVRMTTSAPSATGTASVTPQPSPTGGTTTFGTLDLNGDLFVKGSKTRLEQNMQGQKMVIVTDASSKVAYVLADMMGGRKVASRFDLSKPPAGMEILALVAPSDIGRYLQQSARPLGTETVDGRVTTVYETQFQDPVQNRTVTTKLWVWNERGVVVQQEFDRPGGKTVVQFTDFEFGPQPDTLFEVPSDYQIVDMSGMMGGATPTTTR